MISNDKPGGHISLAHHAVKIGRTCGPPSRSAHQEASLITLELPHPITTNKLWFHSGRSRMLTGEARRWKQAAIFLAKARVKQPIDGDFEAHITIYPKSRRKFDLDNVAKLCLDSLKGVCYEDDRFMTKLTIERGEVRKQGGMLVGLRSSGDET